MNEEKTIATDSSTLQEGTSPILEMEMEKEEKEKAMGNKRRKSVTQIQ